MSSIIKVDQIQLSDGSTPTAGDLGLNLAGADMPTGSILQVIQTEFTGSFSTTATTDAYANSGVKVTITPSSSTSKILILGQVHIYRNASGHNHLQLKRNATTAVHANNDIGGHKAAGGSFHSVTPIVFLDSPNTTASTSYDLFLAKRGGEGGSLIVNDGNGQTTTLTAIEIAG